MEALVVQPQPAGDLPGNIAPQRAHGLPVRQAFQRLQHHHRGDHLGRDRWVAAALDHQVREQPRWEQLMTVVGEEGVHRPVGDQVTAPGRRVQLLIRCMAGRAHDQESAHRQPPTRTTESAQPTGSTRPRPFSGFLEHEASRFLEQGDAARVGVLARDWVDSWCWCWCTAFGTGDQPLEVSPAGTTQG